MVFTWALVKTVTSGEIDIIKWNVPNRCFCLSPIICENPRRILLATGGKFLQLTQLQEKCYPWTQGVAEWGLYLSNVGALKLHNSTKPSHSEQLRHIFSEGDNRPHSAPVRFHCAVKYVMPEIGGPPKRYEKTQNH